MAGPDLPRPDEAHFYLQGSPSDPDMRYEYCRAACPFCDGGRLVDRARDLGVAACCGGCGYYTHRDDPAQRAQVDAERALERHEREASEARIKAEATKQKMRRSRKRQRMAA